jgi:hypothetical protein
VWAGSMGRNWIVEILIWKKKRKYHSKKNLDIIHLIDKYFNRSITSLEGKKSNLCKASLFD